MNAEKMNFKKLAKLEKGTILAKIKTRWLEGMIVRGPASLCAYIGIPEKHPLSSFDYEDIPLSVHGGLTFGDRGDGKFRPAGKYWFGWDYAHWGDKSFYELEYGLSDRNGKGWTVPDVSEELRQAMKEFMWLYFVGWIGLLIKRRIHRATQ